MLNNLNTSETTIAEHKVSGVQPSYSKKQITELFMKAKQQLKDGTLAVQHQVIDQYVDKIIVYPTMVEIYLNVFQDYGVTETV